MEPNNNLKYPDKFAMFTIQVANKLLTGPNRLKPKNLRIGQRIKPSGIIAIITELESNQTSSG